MATCEKCGRALDDEYAKEWHWCPECRAKAGSAPYGSCEICGKDLYEIEKGGICSTCLQNSEELYDSEQVLPESEDEVKSHSGKGCAVVIALGLLAIIIFTCLSAVTRGGGEDAASATTSSSSLTANPQKSVYEIERDADFDEARSYSKDAIKKVAAHPESVNLTDHNKNKFRGGGVFFHDYGKVSFRDSSGADREEEYEHTYITNGTQCVSCYLKIGAAVIYDYREYIDSETGIIISPNFSVGDRSYGQPVVDGRISSSKDWSPRSSQSDDGRIPAEKYSQVKYDVELKFIMNVQELVSTVTGKMDFDYQSFQFVEAGDNVIAVSIDFTSKNVLGVDLKYTAKAAYDYNPVDDSTTLMILGVDDQVYYPAGNN